MRGDSGGLVLPFDIFITRPLKFASFCLLTLDLVQHVFFPKCRSPLFKAWTMVNLVKSDMD
jgi:hypothetical protein